MPRIKIIYFDFGGVVVEGDSGPILYKLIAEKIRGVQEGVVEDCAKKIMPELQKSSITEEEFWDLLCEKLKCAKPSDWQGVLEAHKRTDSDRLNQEIFNLIQKLKQNGYRVGLLTNTIPSHARHNEEQGWYDYFDPDLRIISTEVGMKKPEPEIYKLAIGKAGVSPEQVVFIDDKKVFVDAAVEAGIKGIVFESVEQLKQELEKLGVNVETNP